VWNLLWNISVAECGMLVEAVGENIYLHARIIRGRYYWNNHRGNDDGNVVSIMEEVL
jgi:hypothetical protein